MIFSRTRHKKMATETMWKGFDRSGPDWAAALPSWVTNVEYVREAHAYEITTQFGCSTCMVFVPCGTTTSTAPDAGSLDAALKLGARRVGGNAPISNAHDSRVELI